MYDGDTRQFEKQQETKPEVFSLEGLRDWLKTEPPTKVYCYSNLGDCLIHRYLCAFGLDGSSEYSHFMDTQIRLEIAGDFSHCWQNRAADYTYGAALDRCNKAIAARKGA
jgi:hypothetical protein